ncbi:hypothetical protein A0H81_02454 [Grifola frondosa]|uniref:Major facilitator superfamily (MFS) profile domain-containing protein n=1 Tax=Grifola frondosa TaxID=5627 RepID=A0A1C7MN16_GRIFR|nr:hypothetical protein A0H81_02454 [Grifola frondosa]
METSSQSKLQGGSSLAPEEVSTTVATDSPSPDSFLVAFDPDGHDNPKNWSRRKRWYMTWFAGILGFNATFASSAPSGVAEGLIIQFGLSPELATLTISLFVVGYCVGPLFWGPLSEQYGRRPIFLVSFPIYTCFQVGCALSRNKASIIVFRLLGGLFAAAPLTNMLSSLTSGMRKPEERPSPYSPSPPSSAPHSVPSLEATSRSPVPPGGGSSGSSPSSPARASP